MPATVYFIEIPGTSEQARNNGLNCIPFTILLTNPMLIFEYKSRTQQEIAPDDIDIFSIPALQSSH